MPKSKPLTHFDAHGQAHMVDVGGKAETHRVARASGQIVMLPATLKVIQTGTGKKGDVLGIARIAAIQGAKRTSDLIPLIDKSPFFEKVEFLAPVTKERTRVIVGGAPVDKEKERFKIKMRLEAKRSAP